MTSGASGGIGADVAVALFDLSAVPVGTGAPIGFAVLIGATSVVALRTGIGPEWFAWDGVLTTAGVLAEPVAYIFLGVALLWVSITIGWRDVREQSGGAVAV